MRSIPALLIAALLVAAPVRAQTTSIAAPQPVVSSILTGGSMARPGGLLPSGLFDPSRFSISNTMRFGYTSGGPVQGSSGLFTSSLGYRLSPNMGLQVDVGAHLNPAYGQEGMSKGLFLQGASFSWRPARNAIFRVEYQDLRSPLQYGAWGGNPFYGSGYGRSYGSLLDPEPGSPSGWDPAAGPSRN